VQTITGEPSDLHARLLTANVLFEAGLGPRVYDAWAPPSHSSTLAFAVERLEPATEANGVEDARRGIEKLVAAGALRERTTDWRNAERFGTGSEDPRVRCSGFECFDVPDPSERLRRLLTDELQSDLHFGREARIAGGRYLYQSVPGLDKRGRRNSERRWGRISDMLARTGVNVEDRLVLDVGCNAGMMMAAALRDGAAWTLGWDMPLVASRARELLLAMGCTRFDVFGRQLATDYSLTDDLPQHLAPRVEGSLVLYLAIRHHIGFLDELASMPWKALVYEGGETEDVSTLASTFTELQAKTKFEVVAAENFRDGEGAPRPLAVLLRTQPPLSSDPSEASSPH
jgi:hypothetical protein